MGLVNSVVLISGRNLSQAFAGARCKLAGAEKGGRGRLRLRLRFKAQIANNDNPARPSIRQKPDKHAQPRRDPFGRRRAGMSNVELEKEERGKSKNPSTSTSTRRSHEINF